MNYPGKTDNGWIITEESIVVNPRNIRKFYIIDRNKKNCLIENEIPKEYALCIEMDTKDKYIVSMWQDTKEFIECDLEHMLQDVKPC